MADDLENLLEQIDKISDSNEQIKTTPKLNTFNTKSIVRLIFFSIL